MYTWQVFGMCVCLLVFYMCSHRIHSHYVLSWLFESPTYSVRSNYPLFWFGREGRVAIWICFQQGCGLSGVTQSWFLERDSAVWCNLVPLYCGEARHPCSHYLQNLATHSKTIKMDKWSNRLKGNIWHLKTLVFLHMQNFFRLVSVQSLTMGLGSGLKCCCV